MENVDRAMILAAGEGTRLRPLTLHRPKPMLPVAGRPVLEHIIAWLRYYGITEIVINLHHCPQMVIDHFDDGAAYGVEITYSIEEGCDCRKPMPGMLRQAEREVGVDLSQSFLIGDAVSDIQAARAVGTRGILVLTGRGQ
jgi:mannose-1-phosphate guanylyltransferase/phosphomannomutase